MRESLRLIVVLGIIATISGGVLAYVHQTMSPIIEQNKEAAMGEAILEVLPGAVAFETLTVKTEIGDGDGDSITDATSSSSTSDTTSSSTVADATSSSTVADTTSGGSATDATSSSTLADTSDSTDGTSSGSTSDATSSSTVADATSSSTVADTTSSSTATTDATSGSTTTTDTTSSSTAADTTSGSSASVDATSSSTVADTTSGGSATDATSSSTLADATSGGSTDGTSGSSVVVNVVTTYRGMDAAGKTTGIAFAVDGNGFGGTIRLMVGLNPATRKLSRVKVLEHLETPGLGARITEQAFLAQFENKSIDDTFTAKQDVDAVTGATVSSQAVAATLKAALSEVESDLRAGGVWK